MILCEAWTSAELSYSGQFDRFPVADPISVVVPWGAWNDKVTNQPTNQPTTNHNFSDWWIVVRLVWILGLILQQNPYSDPDFFWFRIATQIQLGNLELGCSELGNSEFRNLEQRNLGSKNWDSGNGGIPGKF